MVLWRLVDNGNYEDVLPVNVVARHKGAMKTFKIEIKNFDEDNILISYKKESQFLPATLYERKVEYKKELMIDVVNEIKDYFRENHILPADNVYFMQLLDMQIQQKLDKDNIITNPTNDSFVIDIDYSYDKSGTENVVDAFGSLGGNYLDDTDEIDDSIIDFNNY